MLQLNDGTWLDEIGERYNLSNWADHHVHMKYCAYVPATPAPDYPFYVTYRLVDDFDTYAATPPFSLVFNVPAPTVEETTPAYRDVLPSLTAAEISFTFHRPVVVAADPPVTITDEATHTQDYYAGYFGYAVSADGLTLTLTQQAGVLPNETWLEIALTDQVRDADNDHAAIPFTHFVYTLHLPGNCDNDGDIDFDDFVLFAGCLSAPGTAVDAACTCDDLDADEDVDLADFLTLQATFTGAAE